MGINSITAHKSDATPIITNNVLILLKLIVLLSLVKAKKNLEDQN